MNQQNPFEAGATVQGFAHEEEVFSRYVLKKIIGRGGMGVVWLGFDKKLEESVALKFLPDNVLADQGAINDLVRETKRSRELTHPNIVRIHDLVEDDRASAIVMEYVDGESLQEARYKRPGEVFTPEELVPIVEQVCTALDYAHNQAKIVHRDIKPANIMLTREGDVKVADFGVARSLCDTKSRMTMIGDSAGTMAYMSPQQLMGEEPSFSDDIYALGATLYELLVGKPPFYSGDITTQIRHKAAPELNIERARAGLAEIDEPWGALIEACLKKEPKDRPKSGRHITRILKGEILETDALQPVKVNKPTKGGKSRYALVLVLLLIAVGGSYYYFKDPGIVVTPSPEREATVYEVDGLNQINEALNKKDLSLAQSLLIDFKNSGGAEVSAQSLISIENRVGALARAHEQIQHAQAKEASGVYTEALSDWEGLLSNEQFSIEASGQIRRIKQLRLPLALMGKSVGAKVYLNNKFVGVVGDELEASVGVCQLRVEKMGFQSFSSELKIGSGVTLPSADLQRETGEIKVSLLPAAAKLVVTLNKSAALDSSEEGKMYSNWSALPTGEYLVSARLDGVGKSERTITVSAGATESTEFKFSCAQLILDSQPSNTEVSMGGKKLGTTPLKVFLPEGNRQIKIQREGYETKNIQVFIPGDRSQVKKSVTLSPSYVLDLPQRGYFSLEELFSETVYSGYSLYAQQKVLVRFQSNLKSLGHYQSKIDGVMGKGMQKAVIDYQKSMGIKHYSGKLDKNTLELLGVPKISEEFKPVPKVEVAFADGSYAGEVTFTYASGRALLSKRIVNISAGGKSFMLNSADVMVGENGKIVRSTISLQGKVEGRVYRSSRQNVVQTGYPKWATEIIRLEMSKDKSFLNITSSFIVGGKKVTGYGMMYKQ